MKALVFEKYGKADHVAFTDLPRPTLRPDEILVQVHAAALNPVDTMIPKGSFKPFLHFRLPATIGSDLAGVVVEVGNQVTRFKPGDAIFASIFGIGTGALAEFAVVPEKFAAFKPENLDFVQAASFPMVGLTSWQALIERIQLKPGQKVFIPAGSGGIGTFAIPLAKHLGTTVATTTSTGNVDLVRSLGADEVIDYKRHEFEQILNGYDAALVTVKGDTVRKSLGILKPMGQIVSLVGPPDAAFARIKGMNFAMVFLMKLLSRKINRMASKKGVSYSFLFVYPNGQQLAEIGNLIKAGNIRPVIDRVFPFEQAKEALTYVEQGRAKGKVVVRLA